MTEYISTTSYRKQITDIPPDATGVYKRDPNKQVSVWIKRSHTHHGGGSAWVYIEDTVTGETLYNNRDADRDVDIKDFIGV